MGIEGKIYIFLKFRPIKMHLFFLLSLIAIEATKYKLIQIQCVLIKTWLLSFSVFRQSQDPSIYLPGLGQE